MKTILAINGSPRKKTTYQAIRDVSAILEPHDIQVDILNLSEIKLNYCAGCQACVSKAAPCWQEDDIPLIFEKMEQCDGVILASPIYMFHISGLMKSFIDRTTCFYHRPQRVVGKPALVVTTASSPTGGQTAQFLEKTALRWGMQPTGKVHVSAMFQKSLSEKSLRNFMRHLEMPKNQYRPSWEQVFYFNFQKATAHAFLPLDWQHYIDHGWDNRDYYYDSRMGLLKKAASAALYSLFKKMFRTEKDGK